MDLLESLIIVSEKAANVARLCRQNQHLFQLLIQQKSSDEANPRFVQDFKTLADVLVQEMVKNQVGNQFPELRNSIKGEENNVFTNTLGESVFVEIKESADETAALLQAVLDGDEEAAKLLALEVHRTVSLEEVNTKLPDTKFSVNLDDLGLWIDPIDSTAEYINGMEKSTESGMTVGGLKCVTVLIGVYSKETGLPIMGVVNQPFLSLQNSKWSGACVWGMAEDSSMKILKDINNTICISSSENHELTKKLENKGFKIVEACGAGYKILTVINGSADAYILSKNSTFKWDTCGPQAILRALGGDVVIFDEAIRGNIVSVTYGNENNCNCGGILAYRNPVVLQNIIDSLMTPDIIDKNEDN